MINNSNPLVTIAIPTCNRADSYLKKSLQSAVKQTYQNIEIVVSDNASTDDTEAVIKHVNDPRIRYFKQSRNIGGLNNANFCLEQAQGDYFLLLHDDDFIDNDFVNVCMEAVNHDINFGIILTGTRVIDENGAVIHEDTNKVEGYSITDFILGWFDYKVPLYLCSTLYNTRRLKEMGGFRSKKNLYEDGVALFQLAAKFGRKDIRDIKASFRRHSDNSGSAASISDWCEDSLYLLDIMCGLAPNGRDLLRTRGMRYFSVQNYIRAARIRSLIKRFHAYIVVYRKFEYSYSPVHYVFAGNIFYKNAYRLLSYLKRKMRETLISA